MAHEDDVNRPLSDQDLDLLQFSTVLYYLHETNPDNGLVRDKTDPHAPVSIAACGMALATIPVVVERGVLFRDFAAKITRKRLRFLLECPQGPEPDASGYKGFFYHFPKSGSAARLIEQLKHGLSTRQSPMLISAPEGFGKATTHFNECRPSNESRAKLFKFSIPRLQNSLK